MDKKKKKNLQYEEIVTEWNILVKVHINQSPIAVNELLAHFLLHSHCFSQLHSPLHHFFL